MPGISNLTVGDMVILLESDITLNSVVLEYH